MFIYSFRCCSGEVISPVKNLVLPMKTSDKTLARFTADWSTVIVTGGSSGIGKALIRNIWKHNPSVRICNISRTKPEGFSNNLPLTHISCDLCDPQALRVAVAEVERQIDSESTTGRVILINNSGFGLYGPFVGHESAAELAMLDLNIRSMVHLSALLLPRLVSSRGAVINIASTAAFQPTPQLSTYGATKAFVLHWSLGLADELRRDGVQVLVVCPGPTATNFFKNAGFDEPPLSAGFGETADAVARTTLNALAKGRWLVVSGWTNRILVCLPRLLPRTLIARLSGLVLRRVRSR